MLFTSQARLAKDEALTNIKKVFGNDWEKAIKYVNNSYWTLDEMYKYGAAMGELPPNSARFCTAELIDSMIEMAPRENP